MAHSVFEVETFIQAPPSEVYNLLSNLHNHTQLHPMIVKVQQDESTMGEDGRKIDHYRIRDRMKIGPWAIQFTYRVDMSSPAQGELVSDAYQTPRIHLHNTTWCLPEGEGTRLKELVNIDAPGLLMKTVHQQGQAAHKELFARIKELLEKSQPETQK